MREASHNLFAIQPFRTEEMEVPVGFFGKQWSFLSFLSFVLDLLKGIHYLKPLLFLILFSLFFLFRSFWSL